jgi:hypothetical protein
MSATDRVVVGMYAFHCDEPRRVAGFWAELMGLPVAAGATDDFVMLDFDHEVGPVTWMFQRAAAGAPRGVNRLGLDIALDDEQRWATAADRAEALGATRLAEHEVDGTRWIELSDPEGNPFRVFAPRPAAP